MIAPQILILVSFLSLTWGLYLAAAVADYVRLRRGKDRRRGEGVRALRRVIVAFCLFMLPFSFFLRTGVVLAGFGDAVGGQIVFFSFAGTNVLGSILCLASLRYD